MLEPIIVVETIEFIDKYCERTAHGLWNEPLNVVSNIAFLIVSVLLFHFFRKNFQGRYRVNWDIVLLIFLAFGITFGSTLWHVFAQKWALYSDIIPILLFINVLILSCFVRVLKLRLISVLLYFSLFQLFNFILQNQFPIETLNGSIFYIPVLVVLIAITFFSLKSTVLNLSVNFSIAIGVFSVALILRTFDLSQCDNFPLGTHFIWHILVAITLYVLTKALMNTEMQLVNERQ